jgi:hemerythrin-like domain-containing protein
MTMIMEMLHDDHVEMAKILNVFEREIEREKRGQNVDFELIRAILDYCGGYPALWHHPLEDLVYHKLRLMDDFQELDLLGNLLTEHEELEQDRLELTAGVDNLEEDVEASHTGFHALAESFLARYRLHMAHEEEELFPEAQRRLSSQDWAEIEVQTLQRRDSPTGTMFGKQFEKLRSEIADATGLAR